MTINHFRVVAGTLIGYNILGTVLTLGGPPAEAGAGTASAVTGGTQFTSPLVLVVLGVAALALTFSPRRRVAGTGVFLVGLFGAGFAIGEISELFQHNVGISTGRWDVVLVGSVIGAAIGITCVVLGAALVVAQRRGSRRVGRTQAA